MAKEMGHEDSYPYPSYAQALPSFAGAYKIVTGQAPADWTLADKAKTLHTALSFGLGTLLPHNHEMTAKAEADDDCKKLMGWAQGTDPGGVGAEAFDWKALIDKLWAFLKTMF